MKRISIKATFLLGLSLGACAFQPDEVPRATSEAPETPIAPVEAEAPPPAPELRIDRPIRAAELPFGVRRLVLGSRARITTEGAEFALELDELRAEPGALIESFEEGQVAAVAQEGRAGGRIFIRARKAVGRLVVNGRGEGGGVGRPGRAGRAGAPGAKGLDAVVQPPWVSEAEGMRGRRLHPGRCVQTAGGGGRGGDGEAGSPGTKGGAGGRSAELEVEIEDGSEFELVPLLVGGKGGQGGPGGPGGRGGTGGAPGNSDDRYCSVKPAFGSVGANGANGASGATGEDGESLPPRIRIGGSF